MQVESEPAKDKIMNTILTSDRIEIVDCMCDDFQGDIGIDIAMGLTASQKYIPSRYFYDSHGSHLFELVCGLPEYYQTRTELAILNDAASFSMAGFDTGYLIELGSGSNRKVRTLLDAAPRPQDICYMPIDVSESALFDASIELLELYPSLKVLGMVADFTKHIEAFPGDRIRLITFFGSTIGNFNEENRLHLLNSVVRLMGPEDRFLIGLDMIKPRDILEKAYNDARGITAQFNKNILNVVNRELNAEFNADYFDHLAFFDETKGRVEMHLKANRSVSVEIGKLGLNVHFERNETIHTEICEKFSRESAERMVLQAGLEIKRWFTDSRGWFSLVELARTL
jgi:L-histidine N-alpha-methyltransferase